MAQEISFSMTLTAANLRVRKLISLGSMLIDQADAIYVDRVVTLTTDAEELDLGDVATSGVSFLANLDEDNDIEVGAIAPDTSFVPVIRIKPGEAWPVRLGTDTPNARTTAGTAKLAYLVLND